MEKFQERLLRLCRNRISRALLGRADEGICPHVSRDDEVHLRGRWSGRGGGRWSLAATGVDQIFQLFTGLEEWNLLGRDFHPLAGLRVAADTGLPLAGAEAAKAA